MTISKIVAVLFVLGVNHSVFADEEGCTAKTNPLSFQQVDKKKIIEQVIQKNSARTFTFFTNGDLLISRVEECGLGLELLYLSQLPFESIIERTNKLKWLVNLNGRDIASLLPKHDLTKIHYNFSVNGEAEGEKHLIKSAQLINTTDIFPETFSESMSYTWIPPVGAE